MTGKERKEYYIYICHIRRHGGFDLKFKYCLDPLDSLNPLDPLDPFFTKNLFFTKRFIFIIKVIIFNILLKTCKKIIFSRQ